MQQLPRKQVAQRKKQRCAKEYKLRHSKSRHSNVNTRTIAYEFRQKTGPVLKSKPGRIPVF